MFCSPFFFWKKRIKAPKQGTITTKKRYNTTDRNISKHRVKKLEKSCGINGAKFVLKRRKVV